MLGGHGLADSPVPLLDALSSRLFLLSLRPHFSTIPPPVKTKQSQQQQQHAQQTVPIRILDCGAGIGRVTKDVLLPFASHVDILESSAHFLDKAAESCSPLAQAHGKTLRYYQVCVPSLPATQTRLPTVCVYVLTRELDCIDV